MEKDWNRFAATGKIQDYLTYCSHAERAEIQEKQTGETEYGTDKHSAGDGNCIHSCR
ncbi:MAG: hypothetical protein K2M46_05825 [Lachnospiraceae bacterium]|nr:hypothetical protein [Lachnospiraceae bacterium]